MYASLLAFVLASTSAHAQAGPTEPENPSEPSPTTEPSAPPTPVAPPPQVQAEQTSGPEVLPPKEETEPRMSEGRMLVSLYNSGFQWGISPGIVFSSGKTGFFLGVRFGYGFDTGPVILVPGIRLAGYFTDPNVYIGMPTFKLVLPIDRFAPFVEGGAGFGYVTEPSKSGFAWMGGGGFMIHFTRVAFGAEASYQKIAGTDFSGISVGPILAIGF
jgi:hypothetical protein